MFNALINSGLIAVPFVIANGMDTRLPKLMMSLGIALALGL